MPGFLAGLLLVVLAGILAGSSAAPIKVMRQFGYDHCRTEPVPGGGSGRK